MFLAELAFNTVSQEITKLDQKKGARDKSLLLSKNELEADRQDLMKFIQEDNSQRKAKEQQEKEELQRKQRKDEELKKLDAQIQHERSDIEKNKDALNYQKDFQSFLLSISDPAFKEQRNKVMNEKKRRLKESWIAYHMHSREMDDIIFTDDEEIHDGQKIMFSWMREQAAQQAANQANLA